jgi:hypothetical protein
MSEDVVGRRGVYEGADGHGGVLRLPRNVDPQLDGTRLASHHPQRYRVDLPADSVEQADFDALIEATIPREVLVRTEQVIQEAGRLAEQGLADTPPIDAASWRRGILLSWLHARDLAVILDALGHPRDVANVHDVEEFALGKRLKERLGSADPWYRDWVLSLPDEARINVGFFNPHLAASMFKWGDAKSGVQNAMDAHRLAAHHVGTPEAPLEWMERAANFVVHHIPREHLGIRHEPRGEWSDLEKRLHEDPAINRSVVGQQIARDAAHLASLLEREGKIIPWQLLRVPAGVQPQQVEHAMLVFRSRRSEALVAAGGMDERAERAPSRELETALRVLERLPETIPQEARSRPHLAALYQRWFDEFQSGGA